MKVILQNFSNVVGIPLFLLYLYSSTKNFMYVPDLIYGAWITER